MGEPVHDSLRDAVLRRLDHLDEAVREADERTLLPLARTEIGRLAEGWRLLLTVHQPDEDGRCRACPRRFRGHRWPCQVWRMAHQHLIGESLPRRERRRPLRDSLTRLLRASRSAQHPTRRPTHRG